MAMDINKIRQDLSELMPTAVIALKQILEGTTSSANIRLKAIELLCDRVGIPALRATITKVDLGPGVYDDVALLAEKRKEIGSRRADISKRIQNLEAIVGGVDGEKKA